MGQAIALRTDYTAGEVRRFAKQAKDAAVLDGASRTEAPIARANNLLVASAAYETAVRLYPRDVIQYRDGARIIARSDGPKSSSMSVTPTPSSHFAV